MSFFQKKAPFWIGILSLLWLQTVRLEARNQILLGGAKNAPADKMQSHFSSEKPSVFLGYYHGIDFDWAAALSIHFRNLYNDEKKQSFSLLSADQAILYKFSLHESATLHMGIKLMYLLPVFNPTLPLERNKEYPTEIGTAAVIGLQYSISDHLNFYYYIERWRGTKTSNLQGVESLLALGFDV